MKRTINVAIMTALIASSVAMADTAKGRDHGRKEQYYSHDSRRDERRHEWRDDRWHYRRYDHRYHDYDRRGYHHGRTRAGEYRHPRGYRPHVWRRGERLPVAYYARPYVVRDYRGCHLRQPPRGAHWVRVNNDVLLAAIATGIVLDVVYDHFY